MDCRGKKENNKKSLSFEQSIKNIIMKKNKFSKRSQSSYLAVGLKLGTSLGDADGRAVGGIVGLTDGSIDGISLGDEVGEEDGGIEYPHSI